MNHRLIMASVAVLLGAVSFGWSMPSTIVDNKPSTRLEIVPIDAARASVLPTSLTEVLDKIPPGSILLNNRTDQAIDAVVTTWDYIDLTGKLRHFRLNCDAYLLPPVDPIVKGNGLSLITPYGCLTGDLFPRLTTGGLLGSPLVPSSEPLSVHPESTIHIRIDSVIFANGDVWGQDNLRYHAEIEERALAIELIVAELENGKRSGMDIRSSAANLRKHAKTELGKAASRRAYYAALLLASPNPEGTFQQLKLHKQLPHFRNLGEQ